MSESEKSDSLDAALEALIKDEASRCLHWRLEGHEPVPVADFMEWGLWMDANRGKCMVKQENVGKYFVSTIFLGLNHRFYGNGRPILFESMVFTGWGGEAIPHSIDSNRCATWEQAERMHEKMVAKCKKGIYEGV